MTNTQYTQKAKLRNLFHTALLLIGMVFLCLLGFVFGGISTAIWAGVIGFLIFFFGPRFSPQLTLRMYRATPIFRQQAPHLYRMVDQLSKQYGIDNAPILYHIPSKLMNAFSLGTNTESVIGLTDALVRNLSLREMIAVLAHEMGHIRNNDMKVMGVADIISRITHFLASLGKIFLLINFPLLFMGLVPIPWLGIVLLLTAPVLSSLMQLALSRTREYEADIDAVRVTGDPYGLASALQKLKIGKFNLLRKLIYPGKGIPAPSILRTHPETDERIERLLAVTGVEPKNKVSIALEDSHLPTGFLKHARKPRWRLTGLWY